MSFFKTVCYVLCFAGGLGFCHSPSQLGAMVSTAAQRCKTLESCGANAEAGTSS